MHLLITKKHLYCGRNEAFDTVKTRFFRFSIYDDYKCFFFLFSNLQKSSFPLNIRLITSYIVVKVTRHSSGHSWTYRRCALSAAGTVMASYITSSPSPFWWLPWNWSTEVAKSGMLERNGGGGKEMLNWIPEEALDDDKSWTIFLRDGTKSCACVEL